MTMPAIDATFVAFQEALAGRYSLERELGRGGMGVVYLAREVRLDRPVAIKLLPPELAAHAPLRDRFLREARTAARLSHPYLQIHARLRAVPVSIRHKRRILRAPLPALLETNKQE